MVTTGLLGLVGCMQSTTSGTQTTSSTSAPQKSVSIFKSSRSSGEADPLRAHMRARKMVDPADTSLTHEYTTLAVEPDNLPPTPRKKPGSEKSFMAALSKIIAPEPGAVTPAHKPHNTNKPKRVATEKMLPPPSRDPVKAAPPQKKPAIYRLSAEEIKRAQNPALRDALQAQKPAQKPEFKKPPKPKTVSLATTVSSVRVGNYADKTRIVMDLSGPAKFDYDRNAKGQNLTINLPGVGWRAQDQQRFSAHPLLDNYKIRTGQKGSVLTIRTKKPAKLIQSSYLPPNHLYGHRIYFDIAPI